MDELNTLQRLSPQLWTSISNYLDKGYDPGSFVRKILSNDIKGAAEAADTSMQNIFGEIVQAIYIEGLIPEGSYGSPEKFKTWQEKAQERRCQ